MTETEKLKRAAKRERWNRNNYNSNKIGTQIAKEDLIKATAMKEHLFGSFLLPIPNVLSPERFSANPRYESYATPAYLDPESMIKNATRRSSVVGQR